MPTAELISFAKANFRNVDVAHVSWQFVVIQIHTINILTEKQKSCIEHDEGRAFHHGSTFIGNHP